MSESISRTERDPEPQEAKRWSVEQAAEEAHQLQGNLKHLNPSQEGRFSTQQYAREHEVLEVESASTLPMPERIEFVLTAELREKILSKIQDVCKYGTAYTWILDNDPGVLESLFQKGVLGLPREGGSMATEEAAADRFKEGLRSGKQTTVSFAIVGRTFRHSTVLRAIKGFNGKSPEGSKAYAKEQDVIMDSGIDSGGREKSGVGIIFDLSSFTEAQPQVSVRRDGNTTPDAEWRGQRDVGTYNIRTADEGDIDPTPNEHGDLVSTIEYGFSLYSRVAPEKFRGVVVVDREHLDKVLAAWASHPESALPIYDQRGDLLWPEQLAHEKILENLETRQPNPDMQRAYALLGASTPLELSQKYRNVDQDLFKSGQWDYKNPNLLTNQVKGILENIDPKDLSEEELEWRESILWFWYHHATSIAIWKHKDKQLALEFVDKALERQDPFNKITMLIKLLIEDRVGEAKAWAATINEDPEKTSASELISEYEQEKWF